MTQASHSPEVVQAFKLLKAGDRAAAGRLLRDYLANNPRDVDAWWLMAHAVSKPESAVKILQKILALDPAHEKARTKLAKLTETAAPDPFAAPAPAADAEKLAAFDRWEPASASETPAPDPFGDTGGGWSADAAVVDLAGDTAPDGAADSTSAASVLDEEPDDDLFFGGESSPKRKSRRASTRASKRASSRRQSTLPVLKPDDVPPAGETGPVTVPIPERSRPADPPAADPFAFEPTESMVEDVGEPDWLSAAQDPAPAAQASTLTFEQYAANTVVEIDPFSGAPANNPFVDLDQFEAEFAGAEAAALPLIGNEGVDKDDPDYGRRTMGDHMIAMAVAGFTVLVLLSTVLFALDNAGTINIFPDLGYGWETLDGGTFAIDYPEDWNKACAREQSNYVVCGIANSPYYNEVGDYVGYDVDLGEQSDDYYSGLGGFGSSEIISVIVMDVPTSSPAYDNGSWAKTLYEYNQYYGYFSNAQYSGRVEKDIDGYTAHTYKFTGDYFWTKVAAWDVYIPHDGIMLWLRVSFYGDTIPERTIDRMIKSINIHPDD